MVKNVVKTATTISNTVKNSSNAIKKNGSSWPKRPDGTPIINSQVEYKLYNEKTGKTSDTKKTANGITNTTGFTRTSGQNNGAEHSYTFTDSFNTMVDNSVAESLAKATDINGKALTNADKEYLQKVLPYMIKGMGASESS